jgi:hypothetical protein
MSTLARTSNPQFFYPGLKSRASHRDAEIAALFKRIGDECMIARPGPAIAARQEKRLIAEECKKRKVSLTELRSGSRRGEIPAVRPEVSRKLVEGYGITIAEIARQVSASTSVILKNLARSYSS